MKRYIIAALAAVTVLAACGGTAHAAPSVQEAPLFKASNGDVISLYNAVSFDNASLNVPAGYIRVYYANGSDGLYEDNGATLAGRFLSYYPNFVKVSGGSTSVGVWVNVSRSVRTVCLSGKTNFGWYGAGNTEYNDGCAIYNALYGKAK